MDTPEKKKSLKLIDDLFQRLKEENVRHCLWKGSKDIDLILLGKKDLDILVDRYQMRQFSLSVGALGFKKIRSPGRKTYPGIVDYLGFDIGTGSLVHLHVHYQLIIGVKDLPNYHLPVEKVLLNNIRHVCGVSLVRQEFELIIFIIQSLIRCQNRDNFPLFAKENFKHLFEGLDEKKFHDYLNVPEFQNLKPLIGDFFSRQRYKHSKNSDIYRSKRDLQHLLRSFQRYPKIQLYWKAAQERFHRSRIKKRFIPNRRKTLENGGLVMSFVGVDGAGKSTVMTETEQWLSWKMDVKKIYMGIPKNLFVKCLTRTSVHMKSLAKKMRNAFGSGSLVSQMVTFISMLSVSAKWLWVARSRYHNFLKARRWAREGSIVLSDRYPLKCFNSMIEPMDGPRIAAEMKPNNSYLIRKLAGLEKKIYEKIIPPDFLFVLQVSETIAINRKKECHKGRNKIHQKIEAIRDIEDPDLKIFKISANRKLPEVLHQVRSRLWEVL